MKMETYKKMIMIIPMKKKKIPGKEILKWIKKFKNNKAGVDDLIINEYIKSTADKIINVYMKLFTSTVI